MEEKEIVKRLMYMADALGFDVNNNVEKIAHIKSKHEEKWRFCCCDPNNPKRYCGSILCEKEIKETGTCLCKLFIDRNKNK